MNLDVKLQHMYYALQLLNKARTNNSSLTHRYYHETVALRYSSLMHQHPTHSSEDPSFRGPRDCQNHLLSQGTAERMCRKHLIAVSIYVCIAIFIHQPHRLWGHGSCSQSPHGERLRLKNDTKRIHVKMLRR